MKTALYILLGLYAIMIIRGLFNRSKKHINLDKPEYYLKSTGEIDAFKETNERTRKRLEKMNALGLKDLTGWGDFGKHADQLTIYIEDVWTNNDAEFDKLLEYFIPIESI